MRIRMFLNTLWWCITASIENHEPLREELKARGYTFVSETDTEVIAHLVNWELKQGGLCVRPFCVLSRSCVVRTVQ